MSERRLFAALNGPRGLPPGQSQVSVFDYGPYWRLSIAVHAHDCPGVVQPRRGRGRPKNEAQDRTIAAAVSQMLFWGFPREEAWKAVAAASLSVLHRDLGAEAVKKVWTRIDPWQPVRIPLWWRKGQQPVELRDALPVEVAKQLLRIGGNWHDGGDDEFPRDEDTPLTAGAEAEYRKNRLRRAGPKPGN